MRCYGSIARLDAFAWVLPIASLHALRIGTCRSKPQCVCSVARAVQSVLLLCACRLTLVALGSLVSSAALRPNTPLASVVICTVVIVVVNLAVNEGYARGWIPHDVLRSHPILLWVNGEVDVQRGTLLTRYAVPTAVHHAVTDVARLIVC
jgi:hypothetical protein